MTLKWEGDKVTAKLRQAQVKGVNETMAAAAVYAKQNHDWKNRTATLEGSIDVVDFAQPSGSGARGTWGSRDVVYARIQEEGGIIKPVSAQALHFVVDGEHVMVQQVTIPARPYLRPAADVEYPKLAARIKRHYEAGA